MNKQDAEMTPERMLKFHWLWRSLQAVPDAFAYAESRWLRRIRVNDVGQVGGEWVDKMYAAHVGPTPPPGVDLGRPDHPARAVQGFAAVRGEDPHVQAEARDAAPDHGRVGRDPPPRVERKAPSRQPRERRARRGAGQEGPGSSCFGKDGEHMKAKPKVKPANAWASVWLDNGKDAICEVSFWREHLQSNLRKIRVLIVPLGRPRRGKKNK